MVKYVNICAFFHNIRSPATCFYYYFQYNICRFCPCYDTRYYEKRSNTTYSCACIIHFSKKSL